MIFKDTIIYKNAFISLATIGIVALAIWTTLSYNPQEKHSAHPTLIPDAYMEDVIAIIMDKQGKPSMKIATPKMIHYAENDTSELTNPQLTIYRKSPHPWFITSKFATAKQGIEDVDFWKDVTIHHVADIASPATLIKTSKLTVHTTKQIAETNEFITLLQPNVVIKATGMIANINTGSVQLLEEARGEYVPAA